MRRTTLTVSSLLTRLAFVGCIAIGCAGDDAQRTLADGPPPEGYETWNDYYDHTDELAAERQYELQKLQQQRNRGPGPGHTR